MSEQWFQVQPRIQSLTYFSRVTAARDDAFNTSSDKVLCQCLKLRKTLQEYHQSFFQIGWLFANSWNLMDQ